MKAATSSIALVALAAFGGLALPCFCKDNPYQALSDYLEEHAKGEPLMAKVEVAWRLLDSIRLSDSEFDEDLANLARAFTRLRNDSVSELCGILTLKGLHVLVEAAINCRKTSPDPFICAKPLDELLINLKAEVHVKCYKFIMSVWEQMKDERLSAFISWNRMIYYLNFEVKENEYLIKHLIYRRGETGERYAVELAKIVVTTLIKNDNYVSSFIHKLQDAKDHLNGLIEKCSNFVHNQLASSTAKPLRQVLALEMMNLTAGRGARSFSMPETLRGFPAYLACKWLIKRPKFDHVMLSVFIRVRMMEEAQKRLRLESQHLAERLTREAERNQ